MQFTAPASRQINNAPPKTRHVEKSWKPDPVKWAKILELDRDLPKQEVPISQKAAGRSGTGKHWRIGRKMKMHDHVRHDNRAPRAKARP
jgi:hypothetical protein